MSEVKSPYVSELDGRKIVFVKMTDTEIEDEYQCSHCVGSCSEAMPNGELVCDQDFEGAWKFADEVTQAATKQESSVKPPEPAAGRKFDSGKPMYSLLPTNALEEVVKVLTVGAVRYNEPIGQENWRLVPDADFRYYNATQRHIMAVKKGERLDLDKDDSKGTNCYHLACAITSLMFRLQTQIEEDIANGTYDENLWKKALN